MVESFTISPFEETRAEWKTLVQRTGFSRLYHDQRWLRLLHEVYGFRLFTGLLRSGTEVIAGSIFARAKFPFAHRFIALPFSDACEPLAIDSTASELLLTRLAATKLPRQSFEIRGTSAPRPWITLDEFRNWELDLVCPAEQLYRGLASNFRRNIRKARRSGVVIEHGHDLTRLNRFYALNARNRHRLGLPSQPKKFFRTALEEFGRTDDMHIWLASRTGRDLATIVLIRNGNRIYYKWSARESSSQDGAGHLLLWSIMETFAGNEMVLDLGRCDVRNQGLSRFKREVGAIGIPLPSSFVPRAPKNTSSEQLSGMSAVASRIWRRLPLVLHEPLSRSIYPYLA